MHSGKIKLRTVFCNPAGRIALLYFIFSFLWIFFSDKLLFIIAKDPHQLTELQTYKGWFFITATTILIFFLVFREIRRKNLVIRLVNDKKNEYESLLQEYNVLGDELRQTNQQLIDINKILTSSEEKYRLFFENINDGAFIYEYAGNLNKGRFLEVNQKLIRQLNFTQDELQKKELSDIFFEGKTVIKEIGRQLKTKKIFSSIRFY